MATGVVLATALRFESPSNEQLMQTYRPPAYFPPYPVVTNPNFSSSVFRDRTERWLQQLKVDMIFCPKIYNMLKDMEVCGLAARVFTKAPKFGLEWVWKCLLMLWVWDDTVDSTDTGKSPEAALSPLLEVHLIMMWSFPDDPILQTKLEPFLTTWRAQRARRK